MVVGLGIGDYSDASTAAAVAFAEQRGLTLRRIDLRGEYGYDIPTAAAVTRRVPCSSCGMSKRHLIDAAALDGGFDVVATGHNLDDEAAVLLGNVLHWQTEYMGRQVPVLPARPGFPRKVKPLVRLAERETAAYCVLRGIDYIVEQRPLGGVRRPRVPCCGAPTTQSRSARWARGTATCATRRRSTSSRPARRAPSTPSTSSSWPRRPTASSPRRPRQRRASCPAPPSGAPP